MNIYDKLDAAGCLLVKISEMKKDEKLSKSSSRLLSQIDSLYNENSFFTADNVEFALRCFGENLSKQHLLKYFPEKNILDNKKRVAAVLIPEKNILGGFSDMIRVLLYGYDFIGRVSKKNKTFLSFVADVIIDFIPEWKNKISFTEERLDYFDVLFTHELEPKEEKLRGYYSKFPGVVREKVKSVATLYGNETKEELISVVHGMMAYFGQTSHSISKLFIPEDYDIVPLLESFEKYKYLSNHNKYLNNYEYYKSIYLINREKFFDNEIILAIPNNEKFISPLGVIYFSFYKDETDLLRLLSENSTMYRFVYGNNNGNRKKIEEVYFSDLFYGDDNAMCINVLEQNL